LAGFTFPGQAPGEMLGTGQLVGLMQGAGVGVDRLLYGSDYPFTKADGVKWLADLMDEGVKALFTEEEIEKIYHANASKLLKDGK